MIEINVSMISLQIKQVNWNHIGYDSYPTDVIVVWLIRHLQEIWGKMQ